MKIMNLIYSGAVTVLALLASCTSEEPGEGGALAEGNRIMASVKESGDKTRTCIEGDPETSESVGVCWTDGDVLGVFEANGAQQARYYKVNEGKERRAEFATTTENFTPKYAYYPYSEINDGRARTQLLGTIPAVMNLENADDIEGDYKYGQAESEKGEAGYKFQFQHFFSLVRIQFQAPEALQGQTLRSIKMSVSRDGQPVDITGDFNFSLVTARYGIITGSNELTLDCPNGITLTADKKISKYISLFPNVRGGDEIEFTIVTDKCEGRLKVTVNPGVIFEREQIYCFPLDTPGIFSNMEIIPVGETTGTFICATYNVDGLPKKISGITVNDDAKEGPGATAMANFINSRDVWDFFGVSEDFNFNDELVAGLTKYEQDEHRGKVTGTSNKTDGLNFFHRKNANFTVTRDAVVKFNDAYGGLSGGANTCIDKGFRVYTVTFSDGAAIKVIITHMNTYSSGNFLEPASKWINAVENQTKQIRDYIIDNCKGYPVVFMGDTNMRYTRHRIKEYFVDVINATGNLSFMDPWIHYQWDDVYPTYGGKSLMVGDATGTDSSTDVIYSGTQKGEVVDKVWVINDSNSPVQLKAETYYRDDTFNDDGLPFDSDRIASGSQNRLADHYPIVVKFTYTYKKK